MINLRLDPGVGVGVNARNRNVSVSSAVADVLSTSPGTGTSSGVSRQCLDCRNTDRGRGQVDNQSCVVLCGSLERGVGW